MRQRRCPSFSYGLRLAANEFEFVAQLFQTIAFHDQKNHQGMKRKNAEEKHLAHGGLEARTGSSHNDRGRMLGAPPANGTEDDGNVDEREDAEERAKKRSAIGFLDQGTQEQIGNVEKPENERGGEPRIPGPVNAPGGLGPNRAGD